MKRLCIVPARANSKRYRNKNVAIVGGKPLVKHTLDVAKKCFDEVIFTSDSSEILKLGADPKITIEKRSEELASDESKVIDTVNFYFDLNECDQIWLCLPTCPLRTKEDVLSCQKLLTEDVDGIISITDYGFPPTLGLNLNKDDIISDWHESRPWQNNNTRSQDHLKVYRPNGAIYGMWAESFKKYRNFYFGKIKGYYMPRERSIDIDTKLDMILVSVIKGLSEEKNLNENES